MRLHGLHCAWGVYADDGLVVGGYCAGIPLTEAYMVPSYFEIIVGMAVGRDVFVSDLCLGCL